MKKNNAVFYASIIFNTLVIVVLFAWGLSGCAPLQTGCKFKCDTCTDVDLHCTDEHTRIEVLPGR